MEIIAVCNHKGGVGKTITSVSLAGALHVIHGKRVLLIDSDPQGNATTHLLGEGVQIDQHLASALINQNFEDVILETKSGIDLAPADIRLSINATIIEDLKHWQYRLRNTLATVSDYYDYVIIDCPPSLKTYPIMALVAADAYLIPTEPEKFANDGLAKILELAEGLQQGLNPKLQLMGIVVTRYNEELRNANHDREMAELRANYGEQMILPRVRRDKTVLDAVELATTIFNVNPEARVSKDYAALVSELLARRQVTLAAG